MPLHALIDRAALRANLQALRSAAPKSKLMAVVKANAYGHGIKPALEALAEADGFAVARLEEAIVIDDQSLTDQRLLLLEGVTSREATQEALQRGFDLVVHNFEQLQWLAGSLCQSDLWIKFDTGMNRLGFAEADFERVVTDLRRLRADWPVSGRCPQLRMMSHFACADEPTREENLAQEQRFSGLKARWEAEFGPVESSFCNSAALLSRPSWHGDWVRPGISLYGVSPFEGVSAEALGLQPVMTLETEVIALRSLKVGESVGYGATWRASRPSKIAILAAGYADGLPRHLPSGAPVLVDGKRASVTGRVSMDMLAVDVSDIPQVRVGSSATLWGKGLPVEEVATAAGTIAYELLCALNQRVPVKVL